MFRNTVWTFISGLATLGVFLNGDPGAVANARPDNPSPYVSKEGGYRFQFPGQPQIAEQKHKTSTGTIVVHVATCESPDGNTAYLVTYFDASPDDLKAGGPDEFLDTGVEGLLKSSGWTLTSKKPIKLGKYPGREVIGEVEAPGAPETGYGRARLYLVENRVFQVILIGPMSKVDPAAFAKILDTFEVSPSMVAVARSDAAPSGAPDTKERRPRPALPKTAPDAEAETKLKKADSAAAPIAWNEGPDPTQPAEVAITLKPAPSKMADIPKEAGRPIRGKDFRETAPSGGLLVGLRIGYVEASGGLRIGSIQPIFQNGGTYKKGGSKGAPIPGVTTVMAKPGYAIGGVRVRSELIVDAIQVVFMKYQDGRLLPGDSYESAWLGDRRVGNLKYVNGEGNPIVGIRGATDGEALNAMGLVAAE